MEFNNYLEGYFFKKKLRNTNNNFLQGKLKQKLPIYTLYRLVPSNVNFRLAWKTPWSDWKTRLRNLLNSKNTESSRKDHLLSKAQNLVMLKMIYHQWEKNFPFDIHANKFVLDIMQKDFLLASPILHDNIRKFIAIVWVSTQPYVVFHCEQIDKANILFRFFEVDNFAKLYFRSNAERNIGIWTRGIRQRIKP